MARLDLQLDADFERDLARFMRLRGLRTRSAAIRLAVREGLERTERGGARRSFAGWIGAALATAPDPSPRFRSDDDLWRRHDGA